MYYVLESMQTSPMELAARDPMIAGILNKYVLYTRAKMHLIFFSSEFALRPVYYFVILLGLKLSMGYMFLTFPLWQILLVIQQWSF